MYLVFRVMDITVRSKVFRTGETITWCNGKSEIYVGLKWRRIFPFQSYWSCYDSKEDCCWCLCTRYKNWFFWNLRNLDNISSKRRSSFTEKQPLQANPIVENQTSKEKIQNRYVASVNTQIRNIFKVSSTEEHCLAIFISCIGRGYCYWIIFP